MKSHVISLVLFISIAANAQYKKENLKLESNVSSKYRYEKLQLYPIRANASFLKENKDVGNYETLKNALEKNKVVIKEANGGEVNTLQIENTSRDTVMILSGEVVQGGKQDRMVAQDVILYPKVKKIWRCIAWNTGGGGPKTAAWSLNTTTPFHQTKCARRPR